MRHSPTLAQACARPHDLRLANEGSAERWAYAPFVIRRQAFWILGGWAILAIPSLVFSAAAFVQARVALGILLLLIGGGAACAFVKTLTVDGDDGIAARDVAALLLLVLAGALSVAAVLTRPTDCRTALTAWEIGLDFPPLVLLVTATGLVGRRLLSGSRWPVSTALASLVVGLQLLCEFTSGCLA